MSKNRVSVIDMGKNLVPPRPFLTPVGALSVVRERLARLVGISPALRGGTETHVLDAFGYYDKPSESERIHRSAGTCAACGRSRLDPAELTCGFAHVPLPLNPPSKMHVRGDTTTGCTGNPSCCPACGIEAFLRAPMMIAPGRAAERPTLASESRPGTMPRKVARRPPSGKRMLATEET